MIVMNPKLPPRSGYVEIELPNGTRTYRSTKTQQKKEQLEEKNNLLKAQVQALSDRNEFVEDCIAEMAMKIYE